MPNPLQMLDTWKNEGNTYSPSSEWKTSQVQLRSTDIICWNLQGITVGKVGPGIVHVPVVLITYQFFGFLEAVEVVDPDAFLLDGPHDF